MSQHQYRGISNELAQALLGRSLLNLSDKEWQIIGKQYQGKTVLVTGAAGSIGQVICQQVLLGLPARLILLDANETGLFYITRDVSQNFCVTEAIPILGSASESRVVNHVFKTYKPDIVIHAAAYKHVPLAESNPVESIINNLRSTMLLTEAAAASGTETFVLISTDKAVNPSGIMGRTKRACELYIRARGHELNHEKKPLRLKRNKNTAKTVFSVVRFGNVLGSGGSLVPILQDQLASGNVITITHPDVRRYWMTIPEAASLVLCCSAHAKADETFILELGTSIRVVDFAERFLEFHGFKVGSDVHIKFIGLRPGERLEEELHYDGLEEKIQFSPQIHIVKTRPYARSEQEIIHLFKKILHAAQSGDVEEATSDLERLVDASYLMDQNLSRKTG